MQDGLLRRERKGATREARDEKRRKRRRPGEEENEKQLCARVVGGRLSSLFGVEDETRRLIHPG